MNDLLEQARDQFTLCCLERPRYRVAWLIGPPMSGKSALARQLSDVQGWRYLNYTLTPGYFDALASTISTYQPEQLIDALQSWCAACDAPVLIVDELDGLLAHWSFEQRLAWASRACRLPFLPCGMVLVTHFFDRNALARYLPDEDQRYCFNIPGETL